MEVELTSTDIILPATDRLDYFSTMSDLEEAIGQNDPITRLVVLYGMIRANGSKATFLIEDSTLYLISDQEFFTMEMRAISTDIDNICNAEVLYAFSPLYGGISGTIDGIVDMFSSYTYDNALFRDRLISAINRVDNTNTISYERDIKPVVDTLHINTPNTEKDLSTAIVKHKLLNITNHILQTYPCNPDIIS